MTTRPLFLLSALVAGACGFGLGRFHSDAPRVDSKASIQVSMAPAPSMSRQGYAPSADWRDTEGRLLTAVRTGSKDDLMLVLRETLGDNLTSERLRELRVETLVNRIVQLGGAEELLGLGGLSGTDYDLIAAGATRAVADKDAAKAEQLVAAMPAGAGRQSATKALMGSLGTNSPKLGLAWLAADKSSREADRQLFEEWAKKDPKAAAEAALVTSKAYENYNVSSVVSQWVQTDLPAAVQWCQGLKGDEQRRALDACVFGLARSDPRAATKFLLDHSGQVDSYIAHDMASSIGDDPDSAAEVLAMLPPGQVRAGMLAGMAQSSLTADPVRAVEWMKTLLPGERGQVVYSIFDQAGQRDPEGAMRLALDKLDGDNRRTALAATMDSWADLDFDAAFQAAVKNLKSTDLKSVLPAMFEGGQFRYSSPEQQLRTVAQIDPQIRPDVLKEIGRMIGGDWCRRGLPGVLAPADRDSLLGGVTEGVFKDPVLMSKVATQLSELQRQEHVRDMTEALSYDDPQRAAEFARNIAGNESGKREALENLTGNWAYVDPAAAETFVQTLPAGETRDVVARKLSDKFRSFDLEAATRVLAQAGGEKARSPMIEALARDWARVDPQHGRDLLESQLRTSAERQRVEALLGTP